MTTSISELIDATARTAAPVVRAVLDDRLGDPTPCPEYTVRDLLNHLIHTVVGGQALAAKQSADFSHPPDYLDGDWRRRFADECLRLARAWAAPDAEEGIYPGLGFPARTMGLMELLELTVHAWDVARATGQDFTPEATTVRELGTLLEEFAPKGREMGMFGQPVAVPKGASGFDAVLAATGRNPQWRPGPA
ncbi:DinB family protein [Flindersiella endophytica]